MATRRHSQLSSYRTYGSVAYAPAYDGTAVRAPRREEVLRPKPRVRPRERVLTRTQVQVREAGQASVFAVIGFLAVGGFAALLLLSYTQYAVLTDQVVTLRSELTTLQTENATLSAEYEKVFDMERIQAAVSICPSLTAWWCTGRRTPRPASRACWRGWRRSSPV